MKKLTIILILILCIAQLKSFAQLPGITYQAVILNPNSKPLPGVNHSNIPLSDQEICLKFSFLNLAGDYEYVEIIQTKTDPFGMVNVIIGKGEQVGGSASSFDKVPWSIAAKFLEVSMDKSGSCAEFILISKQEFTAVPFALFSVNSGGIHSEITQGKSAYQIWIDLGNVGSEQDFIKSLRGPQGPAGTQGATGTTGLAGAEGGDGLSAYQVWLGLGNTGTEANFIASLTGPAGPQGPAGATGPAGTQGTQGTAGAAGSNGLSAYQVWLGLGNTGTEANFIASLTGPAGTQGAAGAAGSNGLSAYQVWLGLGNTGTVDNFIASLTGPAGPQGPAGATGPAGTQGTQGTAGAAGSNGLSAYQVWLGLGNTGTEANFIASLTGPAGPQGPAGATGPTGTQGTAGAAGSNGLSAYQVWLGLGNTGTEANFIASLTGPAGPQGPAGADGVAASAATFVDLSTNQIIGGTKTFTGTVSGVTSVMVGLGDVDNTSDANKPVSTATQTALAAKANAADVTTNLATKVDKVTGKELSTNDYTNAEKTKLAAITGSNTGDQDLSTYATQTALDLKAPIASPTFTGTVTVPTLVAGTNTFPTVRGSANQVLSTNGSGTLTWATPSTVATAYSGVLPVANGGTGSATQNFVDLTTAQTIAGDKTFSSNATFTGTVSGVTSVMVGLGDVDNTSDANKPVSTATQTALDLKAPIASPTFTGTVTVPTLVAGTNTFPTVRGSANQVLSTNGSGTLTWATPSTVATAYSGVLPVANGGTGSATQNFVDLTTAQTIAGDKTFSSNATFNGQKIGKGNATGDSNLAVGAGAMNGVSSGHRNTAIGDNAMQNYVGTSFDNNTSMGFANLVRLTTGYGNTSVGAESMMAITTGHSNTSIGNQSLITTTGDDNVAVGKSAGDGNTAGSNNTFLGSHASPDANLGNLTNATAIGQGAKVTASNTIQLGNTNVTSVKTSGRLTVGTVIYPNAHNTTAGQVLTTDAAGTASWATASGIPYTGATAAVDLGAYDLTVNGIIIGRGAGNINSNSIFGTNALESNITGAYNVAFGNGALRYNTSGSDNVAIGSDALNGNVDGTTNTAIGNNSGVAGGSLSNTTAIGYDAKVNTSNTIQLGNTTVTSVKTSGTITAKRYELTAATAITAASTTTIDLSSGNVLTVNLEANISTLTITNAVVGTYLIKFVQDGTGSRTVTFPTTNWKWSSATVPTITTTAGKTDIVTLIFDGTTYYAAISQNF